MLSTPSKLQIYCHSTFLPVLPPTPPEAHTSTSSAVSPLPSQPCTNHCSITAFLGANEAYCRFTVGFNVTKQAATRYVSHLKHIHQHPDSKEQVENFTSLMFFSQMILWQGSNKAEKGLVHCVQIHLAKNWPPTDFILITTDLFNYCSN